MNNKQLVTVLIASILLSMIMPSNAISIDNTNNEESIDRDEILDNIATINMPFIENIKQYDNNIKYYADISIGRVLIYDDKIVYLLNNTIVEEQIDADSLYAIDRSSTKINYFIGDRDDWITNIPSYNKVVYEIDDGITLEIKAYYGNVEKVFVLEPYADVDDIIIKADATIKDDRWDNIH